MKSELIQRLIMGIIGSGFVISMVSYSFFGFGVVCLILAFLLLFEFYHITAKYHPAKWIGIIIGVYSVVAAVLYLGNAVEFIEIKWVLAPLLLLALSIPLISLFDPKRHAVETMAVTYMGLIYIILPLILFLFMSTQTDGLAYNRFLVLGVFLIIWSNDTGAYFAGKTLGKTKLYQRISPNKTLEGSLGGIILALVVVSILYYFYPSLTYAKWLVLTVVVSTGGILGDLVESQIKRSLTIKDSGSLIPGHGGFLDRFDALIFALPFGFVCSLYL